MYKPCLREGAGHKESPAKFFAGRGIKNLFLGENTET